MTEIDRGQQQKGCWEEKVRRRDNRERDPKLRLKWIYLGLRCSPRATPSWESVSAALANGEDASASLVVEQCRDVRDLIWTLAVIENWLRWICSAFPSRDSGTPRELDTGWLILPYSLSHFFRLPAQASVRFGVVCFEEKFSQCLLNSICEGPTQPLHCP